MRQIEQNQNGVLGIRSSVWLVVLGLALTGLLPIQLSRHDSPAPASDVVPETAVNPETIAPPQATMRRVSHIKFTPAYYRSDAETDDAVMSAVEQMAQDRRTWVDD